MLTFRSRVCEPAISMLMCECFSLTKVFVLTKGVYLVHTFINGLVIGSLDLDLIQVVEKLPVFFKDLHMVITYKDNSPAIERVSLQNLQEHNIDFETRSTMVVIKEWSVPTFLTMPFFSGFDELYLVKAFDVPASLKVDEEFYTPRYYFEESIPDNFVKTFSDLHAHRYLSDGSGLNFVCEPELATELAKLV